MKYHIAQVNRGQLITTYDFSPLSGKSLGFPVHALFLLAKQTVPDHFMLIFSDWSWVAGEYK
jgi:hypothetical protein